MMVTNLCIDFLSCKIVYVCNMGCIKVDTLRPKQNGRHFADYIFKCIFLNDNFWILARISLKYVPYGLIDNSAALVQIMACRLFGAKPLSEAVVVCFSDAYMRKSASVI